MNDEIVRALMAQQIHDEHRRLVEARQMREQPAYSLPANDAEIIQRINAQHAQLANSPQPQPPLAAPQEPQAPYNLLQLLIGGGGAAIGGLAGLAGRRR